ncbi:MAG: rod-binding protein [Pseudomonadota bacterium]
MSDISSVLRPDLPTTATRPDFVRTTEQTEATIRHAAQEFEAVFLTEMLKHAGLGQMPETMNGGVGEAAFADFLARAYADGISQSRSIGIADRVYESLKAEGTQ